MRSEEIQRVVKFDREVGQTLETGLKLMFSALELSDAGEIRELSPVSYELLRDLRGTLNTFLGPDGFKK